MLTYWLCCVLSPKFWKKCVYGVRCAVKKRVNPNGSQYERKLINFSHIANHLQDVKRPLSMYIAPQNLWNGVKYEMIKMMHHSPSNIYICIEINLFSLHNSTFLVFFGTHFLHSISLSNLFRSVRFRELKYVVSHSVE